MKMLKLDIRFNYAHAVLTTFTQFVQNCNIGTLLALWRFRLCAAFWTIFPAKCAACLFKCHGVMVGLVGHFRTCTFGC